jgi:hypothetical protein
MPKIKPRSFVRGGQLRLSINTKPVVKKHLLEAGGRSLIMSYPDFSEECLPGFGAAAL